MVEIKKKNKLQFVLGKKKNHKHRLFPVYRGLCLFGNFYLRSIILFLPSPICKNDVIILILVLYSCLHAVFNIKYRTIGGIIKLQ